MMSVKEIQQQEVDRRLFKALADAGRSALGMPAAVDTFKAWLSEAGLCLASVEGQNNG